MKLCVTDVYWDRVWLVFRLEAADGEAFPALREGLLLDRESRLGAILQTAPGTHELRLNITNAGNCRCVQPGLYRLYATSLENSGEPMSVYLAEGVKKRLKAARNTFAYGKQGGQYTIIPAIARDGQILLRIGDRGEKPLGPRQRLYRFGMRRFLQYYYRSQRAFRFRKKKRILFLSEQNESLGENQTALRDGILNNGLDSKFEIRESCRVTVTKEHLGFNSWKAVVKEIALADYIFLDDHAPLLDWLQLAKKTKVIQLWHGGIGFKASGYSRWGHEGCLPPFSGHRQTTFGICSSEKNRDIFAEIWGINRGQVLPAGMPRLDAFMAPGRAEAARQALEDRHPQAAGRRLILYAPTYRGNSRMDAFFPYDQIDWQALHEACGEEFAVLVKMHPWVRQAPPIPGECADLILDACGEDTAELLLAADLLVTDYSSVIFEFALRKKPMLFYAFDLEDYLQTRGIHGSYQDMAPGKVVRTFPELTEALAAGDFEEERADAYRERHFSPPYTGNTDRVIDWVLLDAMPEKIRNEWKESRDMAARIGRKTGGRRSS